MARTPLAHKLARWLNDGKKTYGDLDELFDYKSQWLLIIFLMAPAALPLPTGGVTHILEVLSMIISLRLLIGKKALWLPAKWKHKPISKLFKTRYINKLASLENLSRPRWVKLMENNRFLNLAGLLSFLFTLMAFLAPPFTGLDTLPALAVVLISASIILDDSLIFAVAIVCGVTGIGLELALGSLAWHLIG